MSALILHHIAAASFCKASADASKNVALDYEALRRWPRDFESFAYKMIKYGSSDGANIEMEVSNSNKYIQALFN